MAYQSHRHYLCIEIPYVSCQDNEWIIYKNISKSDMDEEAYAYCELAAFQ